MARTIGFDVSLEPRSVSLRPPPPPLYHPIFEADLSVADAFQVDADSVIVKPSGSDIYDADDMENGRWRENSSKRNCWRATRLYEKVGETPPWIVP